MQVLVNSVPHATATRSVLFQSASRRMSPRTTQYHSILLQALKSTLSVVLWSEENVKSSPFKVNLIPPDASKCVVTGPEIPLEQDQPVVLHVDATHAGNGKLDARAIGDSAGASDVDIKEVEPNKFDVFFSPRKPDYYNLDVTWGDQSVPGAPYRLDLSVARADEVVIAEPPTAMLEAGQAIGICFDTSKAGRGERELQCVRVIRLGKFQ